MLIYALAPARNIRLCWLFQLAIVWKFSDACLLPTGAMWVILVIAVGFRAAICRRNIPAAGFTLIPTTMVALAFQLWHSGLISIGIATIAAVIFTTSGIVGVVRHHHRQCGIVMARHRGFQTVVVPTWTSHVVSSIAIVSVTAIGWCVIRTVIAVVIPVIRTRNVVTTVRVSRHSLMDDQVVSLRAAMMATAGRRRGRRWMVRDRVQMDALYLHVFRVIQTAPVRKSEVFHSLLKTVKFSTCFIKKGRFKAALFACW
jgi:hypothetical protein